MFASAAAHPLCESLFRCSAFELLIVRLLLARADDLGRGGGHQTAVRRRPLVVVAGLRRDHGAAKTEEHG